MLTKKEANAVLSAQRKIRKACSILRARLSPRELQYADAYYVSATENIWRGTSHGSAPIEQALQVTEY